jgi:translation initiation factor IF-2
VDILEVAGAHAIIYGFNVKVNQRALEMAMEKNVPTRTFTIIYDLLNDVKKEIAKLITYKVEIIELGRAKVIAIFRTEKSHMIIGALVTTGKLEKGGQAHILRDNKEIGQATINQLQQAKQEVPTIASGTECGIQLTTSTPVQVGDFLEVYKEELKK